MPVQEPVQEPVEKANPNAVNPRGLSHPEQTLLQKIDAARAEASLPSLQVSDELMDRARKWATKMARAGEVSVSGETDVFENVGETLVWEDTFPPISTTDEQEDILLNGDFGLVGLGIDTRNQPEAKGDLSSRRVFISVMFQ